MYKVKLFANFRDNREKEYDMDSADYPTGVEVLKYLDIDPEDVATYLINGFKSDIDTELKAGDTVAVFPPVGGG